MKPSEIESSEIEGEQVGGNVAEKDSGGHMHLASALYSLCFG